MPQPDPRNAAAPGWETEGETKTQQGHADTPIVSPAVDLHQDAPGPTTPEEREARAQRARRRLREADDRRRAARALSDVLDHIEEREALSRSDHWTRGLGNRLVAQGFAPEYVALLLDLPAPRQAVAA